MRYICLYVSLCAGLVAGDCSFTVGLSACSPAGLRTAVEFPTSRNCPLYAPTIYHGLPCDVDCPPGTYVAFNTATNASECFKCPSNHYSAGGALAYRFPNLEQILKDFSPNCYRQQMSLQGKCGSWRLDRPDEIETAASTEGGWQESHLTGKFLLVKPGRLTLKYRKQNRSLSGQPVGWFSVSVNGEARMNDSSLDYDWKRESVDLPTGDVEVWVRYRFYHIEGVAMKAGISEIEIAGVKKADTECWKCENGWSLPGASTCSSCPANTYYESGSHSCQPCPANRYSPSNSLSITACRPRPDCTEADYLITFGLCINDEQAVFTSLRANTVCFDADERVGQKTEKCRKCLPGYHYEHQKEGLKCVPCPKGTHSGFNDLEECVQCTAGQYAPLVLNYTRWHPLPEGLVNECVATNGLLCNGNNGWETDEPVLISESQGALDEELWLSRYVDIVQTPAYVRFSYTINGEAGARALALEVDGFEVVSYTDPGLELLSVPVPLSKGIRKLALILRSFRDTPQTIVLLHHMEIVGAFDGGASNCTVCSPGYISTQDHSGCLECPSGHTSANGTNCTVCPEGYFAPAEGSMCRRCPKNTASNANRTECVAVEYVETVTTFKNETKTRKISMQALTRLNNYPGICNKTSIRPHCKDSFYGPIHHNSTHFYVSILNPGKLRAGLVSNRTVYAYSRKASSQCGQSTEEVVSLGARVEAVETNRTTVVVKYGDGGACGKGMWRSRIELVCDKSAAEGWPTVTYFNACEVAFLWRTAFICPICEESDLLRLTSNCQHGYRNESVREPHNCIPSATIDYSKHRLRCSAVEDVMNSWTAVAGFVLFTLLLPLSFILLIYYIKLKRRYFSLMEMSNIRVHD